MIDFLIRHFALDALENWNQDTEHQRHLAVEAFSGSIARDDWARKHNRNHKELLAEIERRAGRAISYRDLGQAIGYYNREMARLHELRSIGKPR